MKTILYIQHAGTLRGACISLLYTLQGLDRTRYRPVVAVIRPSSEVIQLYASQGIETLAWPGISTFEHTSGQWTAFGQPRTWPATLWTATGWWQSERRTLALVDAVRPDLVHLNSAVLVSSAHTLYRNHIPFVWHVREGSVRGYYGVRYRYMQRAMLRWPSELIFLSEAERLDWVDGVRGRVIPNFVDFSRFDRSLDGRQVRRELGIDQKAKLVLFLGGISPVKGIFSLLEALALAKAKESRLICLMPGSVPKPSARWVSRMARSVLPAVGLGTRSQMVDRAIQRFGLEQTCIRLPFTPEVEKLFAACDLLVFPSLTNHFARPVVEAAAMGKPVIASCFPILVELVKHNETGLLVLPGQPLPLANAMLELLQNPQRSACLGDRAYRMARTRYDAGINTQAIMQVYEDVLATPKG